jgi:hypothetical protein
MNNLNQQVIEVMCALDDMIHDAQIEGDGDLSCAASRAWRELNGYKTVMMKDKIAAGRPAASNGVRGSGSGS